MKKHLLSSLFVVLSAFSYATEGMWIPAVLGAVHDDMKANGLKLSAEELYSINKSSLKDAILLFGGGCTGEMVSPQGLFFTNHHCGFDYIQFHSTLQNNYVKDGFWAKNKNGELICTGLSVSFVVRMDDVTKEMRNGITGNMNQSEIDAILKKNKAALEENYKKENSGLSVVIKAFNYGNQFFATLSRTYTDVRLVGAPPSSIGGFGGDTDNWVWPRHSGDFSVFRIYAGKDNMPAAYSVENVPYKPAHHLPISMEGVEEGDFSMVYGFPGRTDHLLTSYALDYIMYDSNPMRINMRETTLNVIKPRMSMDSQIKLKYAAKEKDISNAWKKWKGQNIGLTNMNAIAIKKMQEENFMLMTEKEEFRKYKNILPKLDSLYKEIKPYALARESFIEYMFYGPELFAFAQRFRELTEKHDQLKADGKLEETIKKLKTDARLFYKDFDLATEIDIYARLSPLFCFVYDPFLTYKEPDLDPWTSFGKKQYNETIFRDSTLLFKELDKFGKSSVKKFKKDYFFLTSNKVFDAYYETYIPNYRKLQGEIDYYMQQYTEALMLIEPGPHWSDANSTLRLTYGKVGGSEPRDGEIYRYYTTSDGIIDKYNTKNPDFELTDRLIDLLIKRQFGPYGVNGELRICYTGSNHTTGGNSGSPALNDKGELVGINFDRSWESTMSDIVYNPDICRNIMVDIRYVLWVIDIYAESGYLLDEMTIIGKR